jgi:hypothetical protein
LTQSTAENLPGQIARVRQLSQTILAGLAMSVGADCSETLLIKNNRLWGFRFSLANFHARWEIHSSEILVSQEDRQLQRITLERAESLEQRRVA